MIFSGTVILIVGVMNVIYGIAAIDNSTFFIQDARYGVFSDLNTWGWILLVVAPSSSRRLRHLVAHGVGTLDRHHLRELQRVIQLLFISSFPAASLALFALDLLVIYGLAAWAHREPSS